MRAATGLDSGQLHRAVDVADVEDPHATEPFGVHRTGRALRAAVDPAARLLDRHEQQVSVDRHVALTAGADERRPQLRVGGIGEVVDLEAVEASDDGIGPAEREVGVDEAEVVRRGIERRDSWVVVEQLHVAARLAPREVPGRQANPRVYDLTGHHRRDQQHADGGDGGDGDSPHPPGACTVQVCRQHCHRTPFGRSDPPPSLLVATRRTARYEAN